MENAHWDFPESNLCLPAACFVQTNRPKRKKHSTHNQEKQQSVTFEKLEPVNRLSKLLWTFLSINKIDPID